MGQTVCHCLICGSSNTREIRKGVYGDADARVIRCDECRVKYLLPQMAHAEEEKFYQKEYFHVLSERQGKPDNTPQNHFEKNRDEAERRLSYLSSFLTRETKVLEVGSSTGYLMAAMAGLAGSVMGIEPDHGYREYANLRGLSTAANIQDAGQKKFDLILHYYVLEHIQSPLPFLSLLRGLLASNGKIIFEIPNGEEALFDLFDCEPYKGFGFQKAHRFYYSSEGLKRLLEKAGFSAQIKCLQRYDISNHLHWLQKGKPGGSGSFNHVFSRATDLSYKNDLMANGFGDTLLAICTMKKAAVSENVLA